jgi:AcrR family transcriptional regulator
MSPRTAIQFSEIREVKKTHIMEVALQHFAGQGYHATTINHLAKHAGISKGLIYHYFESKEELLTEIIRQSVNEINRYLDINKDGRLDEIEFEGFLKKLLVILSEKKSFWRLIFQLIVQNEVRHRFRNALSLDIITGSSPENISGESIFLSDSLKLIFDYFVSKKESKEAGYDPYLEFNLFLITLIGYAINYLNKEKEDEYYEKTMDAIIRRFK